MASTRNRRVQSNSRHRSNPTPALKTTGNNHFLLYIEETASYLIVGKRRVKKINEQGFAIISMKRKMISTKIILNGKFQLLTLSLILSSLDCMILGSLEQCENHIERLKGNFYELTGAQFFFDANYRVI